MSVWNPGPGPRCQRDLRAVIGTVRRQCLDRMLILGRGHLEAVLAPYVEHDNSLRPHRSLHQRAPSMLDVIPAPVDDIDPARIRRTDRLGALIHECRMVA